MADPSKRAELLSEIAALREFIPISPMSFVCPRCGAQPGEHCMVELEAVHLERVQAAAAQDQKRRGPTARSLDHTFEPLPAN
jgi:hypothetical protein